MEKTKPALGEQARATDDRADCIVGGIGNRELQACAVKVGDCAVRGPDRPPRTLLEAADVRVISACRRFWRADRC